MLVAVVRMRNVCGIRLQKLNMEGFTSVSQGFFVRKPKRKPANDVLDQHALQHFKDPLETAPLRHELYDEHKQSFQAKIENLEKSWHNNFTEDVCGFISSSVPMACEQEHFIPAAVLVAGLTQDENIQLFNSVLETVRESFPHIARASSSSCPNVKSAFQNIGKQLMQSKHPNVSRFVDESRVDPEDSFDDTEDETEQQPAVEIKRQISVYDLKNWYKSKTSSSSAVPVVLIVLEDIDVFPDNVISDLLKLLSCCNFPIILILGVLHGFVPIEQLVPSEAESRCKYKWFYSRVSAQARLEEFLNVIMLDWDFPFRLSGDIIRFMSNYYLNSQFSLMRLLQAYQLCLMEHFRSPMTAFCSPDLARVCEEASKEYSNEILEQTLHSIPSWVKFNEGREYQIATTPTKSPSKRMKMKLLRVPAKDPLENIQSKVTESYKNFLEWQIMLLVVYEMGADLPENPVGNSLFQLYSTAWSGDLFRKASAEDHSPFQKLILLLNNFSRQEMERRLSNALNRVNEFMVRNKNSKLVKMTSSEIPKVLEDFINRLKPEPPKPVKKEPEEPVEPKEAKNSEEPVGPKVKKEPEEPVDPKELKKESNPENQGTASPRRKSVRIEQIAENNWTRIRENLLKTIQVKSKSKDPEFMELRGQVKLFLEVNTKNKLKPSPQTSIPFAEVYVFSDLQYIRNQISPDVLRRIHTALCSPAPYLKCECCKGLEPGAMSACLPDTSILYLLYLEQTSKRLNLNDMFMSFKTIIDPSPTTGRKASLSKKAGAKQRQHLLRFKQAVSELEFMGFMRFTGKPDQVYKQTWIYGAHSSADQPRSRETDEDDDDDDDDDQDDED